MDFDDLLFRCVNLFELFPEVRARYQQAFRYVLVDEYQDTNRAQYRWLQLLTEEHRNLCVVGDDDQSDLRASVAPTCATSSTSRTTSRTPRWSSSRRTTARRRRSSTPPTRSSRTTGRASRSRSGASSARASRSTCASSTTSTPRRASSSPRSSGSWTRASRATRSRSSTAPTPRAGCSRTCSSATASTTRCIGGPQFYDRAEIKDALAYLTLLVNPSDIVAFRAHRQLAAARDRQHLAGPDRRLREHDRRAGLGRRRRCGRRCPASARRRSRRSDRFMA